MPMRKDQKQISVRFDNELYQYIKDRAKKNKRTLNAELNVIIEEGLNWEGEIEDNSKGETNRA